MISSLTPQSYVYAVNLFDIYLKYLLFRVQIFMELQNSIILSINYYIMIKTFSAHKSIQYSLKCDTMFVVCQPTHSVSFIQIDNLDTLPQLINQNKDRYQIIVIGPTQQQLLLLLQNKSKQDAYRQQIPKEFKQDAQVQSLIDDDNQSIYKKLEMITQAMTKKLQQKQYQDKANQQLVIINRKKENLQENIENKRNQLLALIAAENLYAEKKAKKQLKKLEKQLQDLSKRGSKLQSSLNQIWGVSKCVQQHKKTNQ